MADNSPRLDLPYLQPSQAQKHVTHNEALQRLDAVVQLAVAAFDAVSPPGAPATGEVHALGGSPTDAWAGQAGQLALWDGVAWQFFAPGTGWRAWGIAEGALKVFDGSAWVDLDGSGGSTAQLGINTSADTTNRLAVASDAALFTHDGAGHQIKVNKATAGDTASLLFQSGFAGHAEMGLAGDTDFRIKVSPDGSVFNTALRVDAASGQVSFPSGANGTGSAAGALGGQIVAIFGEEANTFAVGKLMSMGNGSTTVGGAVMPFAGKVLAATMSISGGTSGLNTASMAVNTVENTGFQVSATYSGSGIDTGVADFSAAPLAFSAGDALNMIGAVSSGASDVVTTFYVVFD